MDHAELSRLALAAAPGADGLTLVPYFEGERTPNLPDATASLTGMTLASTTRENLARAAVEGMLSGLGAGLEALRELGVPLEKALLIGGGAQSEAVRVIAPHRAGRAGRGPRTGRVRRAGRCASGREHRSGLTRRARVHNSAKSCCRDATVRDFPRVPCDAASELEDCARSPHRSRDSGRPTPRSPVTECDIRGNL